LPKGMSRKVMRRGANRLFRQHESDRPEVMGQISEAGG
jgi:hypothetical protein